MEKTLTALVVIGMGIGAWMLYKKYNPECAEEMKQTMNKVSKNAMKSIENMM